MSLTDEEQKLWISTHKTERDLLAKSNHSLHIALIDLMNEASLLRGSVSDLEVMLFDARRDIIELNRRLAASKVLTNTLELSMIETRGQYDQLRLKLRKEGT